MQTFGLALLLPLLLVCLHCCQKDHIPDFKYCGPVSRYYNFEIDYTNYTVGCASKQIIAVNGQSPGPTIRFTRGDRIIINVTNLVASNMTIHWHGINQRFSCWSDGPAYIAQCPIQTGKSYIYNFTVTDQQGTLFWHAHIAWSRSTVYGAIIIDHYDPQTLPFPKTKGEHTLILGEWWNEDVLFVEKEATINGSAARLSSAYLINGYPGPLFGCSAGTQIVDVEKGHKYLLRVINNALETDLFVTIANHSLTVVETDASYTKQITNTSFLTSPGQTYTFLVTADQAVRQYYIVVSPYNRSTLGVQETPALAILRYKGANTKEFPVYPDKVPLKNDSVFFDQSQRSIRHLNSKAWPTEVPKTIDVNLFWVVAVNLEPCTISPTSLCQGIPYNISGTNGTNIPAFTSFASSINNITFQRPDIAILQSYYYNIKGVYTSDFPKAPANPYNYTNMPWDISILASTKGTKVTEIPYGSNVQLVLQGVSVPVTEAHPFHLHGYDFYVVGYGEGNYDPDKDPASFNLVDPARRNTGMVTRGGWTALRFKADNPGVWLIHCHFDGHVSWGMETAFIVRNGPHPDQVLPPPPSDLPTC